MPKYKVDSVIQTPEVVTTPVLLGTIVEKHLKQKRDVSNANNLVMDQMVNINKPVYGEVRRVMNVNTHMTQYIDAFTGKRMDQMGQANIGFHGTEDHNVEKDPDAL